MESIAVSWSGQKVCPCCSAVGKQAKIESAYYTEWQMFCGACRFFERFRIPKVAYTIVAPEGMASAYYSSRGAELMRIAGEVKAREQNAWANLEGVACF